MKPRSPLAGLLIALIAGITVLGLVYATDIVLGVLDFANNEIGVIMNNQTSNYYSNLADNAGTAVAYLIVATLIVIVIAYSLHLKRRIG